MPVDGGPQCAAAFRQWVEKRAAGTYPCHALLPRLSRPATNGGRSVKQRLERPPRIGKNPLLVGVVLDWPAEAGRDLRARHSTGDAPGVRLPIWLLDRVRLRQLALRRRRVLADEQLPCLLQSSSRPVPGTLSRFRADVCAPGFVAMADDDPSHLARSSGGSYACTGATRRGLPWTTGSTPSARSGLSTLRAGAGEHHPWFALGVLCSAFDPAGRWDVGPGPKDYCGGPV